jgi:amidohydrolase
MNNSTLFQTIEHEVNQVFDEVVAVRRHIHQFPELSFQEFKTSIFIKEKLIEFGIEVESIAETGLVAVIHPTNEALKGNCLALRADLDALPIHEQSGEEFSSQIDGVMHACGHDVHSSILIGVAKIIQANRSLLNRSIKLIFQPGEEKLPGGASILIEAGVLENPKVEEIIALHVFPELEVGKVGFKSGMYMASCDELFMTVNGVGGHGAMPHQVVDPILIGSHIIVQLQQIVSRACDPKIPCVLSFGHFEAIGATNVIPDKAYLKGTFRTMDEEWREKAHLLIKNQAELIAQSLGGSVEVRIDKGYPFLENNEKLTSRLKSSACTILGVDSVVDLPIRLTAEDFSFYSQKVPASFFRLGVRNEALNAIYGVHNSKFKIDEEAMKTGMKTILSYVFTQRKYF